MHRDEGKQLRIVDATVELMLPQMSDKDVT